MMSQGGTDRIIMVRELLPRDMVTLSVTVADEVQHRGGMSIVVDTSRVWMEDACVLGGDGSSGTQADDALSITEAVKSAGREDVWVCGYIVGGSECLAYPVLEISKIHTNSGKHLENSATTKKRR